MIIYVWGPTFNVTIRKTGYPFISLTKNHNVHVLTKLEVGPVWTDMVGTAHNTFHDESKAQRIQKTIVFMDSLGRKMEEMQL